MSFSLTSFSLQLHVAIARIFLPSRFSLASFFLTSFSHAFLPSCLSLLASFSPRSCNCLSPLASFSLPHVFFSSLLSPLTFLPSRFSPHVFLHSRLSLLTYASFSPHVSPIWHFSPCDILSPLMFFPLACFSPPPCIFAPLHYSPPCIFRALAFFTPLHFSPSFVFLPYCFFSPYCFSPLLFSSPFVFLPLFFLSPFCFSPLLFFSPFCFSPPFVFSPFCFSPPIVFLPLLFFSPFCFSLPIVFLPLLFFSPFCFSPPFVFLSLLFFSLFCFSPPFVFLPLFFFSPFCFSPLLFFSPDPYCLLPLLFFSPYCFSPLLFFSPFCFSPPIVFLPFCFAPPFVFLPLLFFSPYCFSPPFVFLPLLFFSPLRFSPPCIFLSLAPDVTVQFDSFHSFTTSWKVCMEDCSDESFLWGLDSNHSGYGVISHLKMRNIRSTRLDHYPSHILSAMNHLCMDGIAYHDASNLLTKVLPLMKNLTSLHLAAYQGPDSFTTKPLCDVLFGQSSLNLLTLEMPIFTENSFDLLEANTGLAKVQVASRNTLPFQPLLSILQNNKSIKELRWGHCDELDSEKVNALNMALSTNTTLKQLTVVTSHFSSTVEPDPRMKLIS